MNFQIQNSTDQWLLYFIFFDDPALGKLTNYCCIGGVKVYFLQTNYGIKSEF